MVDFDVMRSKVKDAADQVKGQGTADHPTNVTTLGSFISYIPR